MKTNSARPRADRSEGRRQPERRAGWLWVAGALVATLESVACKASVHADANVSTDSKSGQPLQSFDRPLDAPMVKAEAASDGLDVEEYALLGARHDLNYTGSKEPSCLCLAVALRDRPDDAAFQWELPPPRLDPAAQWVIALSSNEVPCESPPAGTLGASYQGYAVDGNDVVVFVEALGEGRPMTNGAIVPRPKDGGAVYVESAGAAYGKPLDAKGKRCKIAPPVAVATKP